MCGWDRLFVIARGIERPTPSTENGDLDDGRVTMRESSVARELCDEPMRTHRQIAGDEVDGRRARRGLETHASEQDVVAAERNHALDEVTRFRIDGSRQEHRRPDARRCWGRVERSGGHTWNSRLNRRRRRKS